MATTRSRTSARGKKSSGRKTGVTSQIKEFGSNTTELLQGWAGKPVLKYVAGGVGIAVLARLAIKLYDRYPQISTFLQENLDTVEGKLAEYKNGITGSDASSTEAH